MSSKFLRYVSLCIAAALLLGCVADAQAAVFVSGRIDMNASDAGILVGSEALAAKNLRLSNGTSVSYSNTLTNDVNPYAAPEVGDLSPTVGVVRLPGATSHPDGGSADVVDFGLSSDIVAIIALVPKVTSYANGLTEVTFQGAAGEVRIYDRTGLGSIDAEDPSTWLPDINDLSNGLLATLVMADRPTAVLAGDPLGFTDIPLVGDASQINNISADLTNALVEVDIDLKLHISDLGEFFANPDFRGIYPWIVPDGVDEGEDPIPALLINLDEILDGPKGSTSGQFQNPDIAGLNLIFDGFLGNAAGTNGFADGTGTGNDFVLPDAANFGSNGDIALRIQGGTAWPGAQFNAIPEPASVLTWIGLFGAFALFVRRRRASK